MNLSENTPAVLRVALFLQSLVWGGVERAMPELGRGFVEHGLAGQRHQGTDVIAAIWNGECASCT